jgi:hypothetical protein
MLNLPLTIFVKIGEIVKYHPNQWEKEEIIGKDIVEEGVVYFFMGKTSKYHCV